MSILNVGDRVRLKPAEYLRNNADFGWDEDMARCCDTVVTISYIDGSVYYLEEDYHDYMWGINDFDLDTIIKTNTVKEVNEKSDMTKEDLKNAWGAYCDTDKLVDDMMKLLTKYHHRNTEKGVCMVLDEYFKNKHELIDFISQSEHYLGDMRIALDVEIERENSEYDVRRFVEGFSDNIKATEVILKYIDDSGKTLGDYLKTGVKKIKAKDLLKKDFIDKLQSNNEQKNTFCDDGSTKSSNLEFQTFCRMMMEMRREFRPTISGMGAAGVNAVANGKLRISEGMKTARAFNRICNSYGIGKAPSSKLKKDEELYRLYNQEFAKYADMVSGLKRKLKFFISVNPIDYLTMSFGVNWASCHTIDQRNQRHMPNSYSGMYCGGTMSYMLDGTSIITFVNDHIPEDWEDGKIYRCMFHYYDALLVQGRVYPQGNDGNTDLYKVFRGFVQDEFSKLLNLTDNKWTKVTSRSVESFTSSIGNHYRDYASFSDCCVSYPKEKPECLSRTVYIGHLPMCVCCGKTDRDIGSGTLTHYECE